MQQTTCTRNALSNALKWLDARQTLTVGRARRWHGRNRTASITTNC